MSDTYMALAHFAQTWGLLYCFIVFVVVLAYALWPSRKRQFDEAAHMPLRED
jgi:cytochrome c oxidase cbb3-type subunit 4